MVGGKKCAKCGKDMPYFPRFKGWKLIDHGQEVGFVADAAQIKRAILYCPECYQSTTKNERAKGESDYQKDLKATLTNALILEKDEKIVEFWEGDYEARMTVAENTFLGKQVRTVKQTKKGILVLTDRKLVWVEARGVFGKSYHQQFAIPLENLTGISMGGAMLKYVSISNAQGEYVFHFPYSIREESQFNLFKETVFSQVDARKRELEADRRRERVHFMLDFSFLKNYMAKGGLVMEVIKCPECGASLKFPESGNQIECKHCGNTIYAQDLFEKVKKLIG